MIKTVLIIISVLTLLFFAALYTGTFFTEEYVEDRVEELINIGVSPPKYFSEADLNDLPLNVRRYLRLAIDEGIKIPQFVRIKQKGVFKTDINSDWKDFSAEEYFSVNEPGFVWNAKIETTPFFWIQAIESYVNRSGSVIIKFLSSVNITGLTGNEIDISSLIRYYSEAVYFPAAFLNKNITWKYKSFNSSSAVFRVNDMKFTMNFFFDENGLIEKIESPDRFRTTKTGFQKTGYVVLFGDYKKLNGISVPSKAEFQWRLPGVDFTYAKFEIVSIDYDDPKLYE